MKEAGYAKQLDLARQAKNQRDRVVEVIPQFQVRFWIDEEAKLTDEKGLYYLCAYRPDFKVTYADGHQEIVEVKGFWTAEGKLKWTLLEALYSTKYPDVVLTLIQ
jgi:predicted nuclease of restriction endonuclease-like RecB superfamily